MLRNLLIAGAAAFALAAPASAVTVEVSQSEAFMEKLADDYGEREAAVLTEALQRKIEMAFERDGVNAERVSVVIEDAKPNRPTFQQLSDRLGLDPIRSISIGGAKVHGTAYDASGAVIGELEYDWYETDITQAVGVTTWHDAKWAFDRFARKFARSIS